MWIAVPEWMSSEVCVSLLEMRGRDTAAKYLWPRYYVTHLRDGLLASGREFGIDDEAAAFAYADSPAQEHSRLVVRNRASVVADGIVESLRANDSAGVVALFADGLVYDDRRHLGGGTVATGRSTSSASGGFASVLALRQHNAGRAWRATCTGSDSLSDSAGNATGYLHLFRLDDEGLVTYEGRFDGTTSSAPTTSELDRRYYSGEGVEFADGGRANSGWVGASGAVTSRWFGGSRRRTSRWLAPPSSLKAARRTVGDMFEWMRVRGERLRPSDIGSR